MAGAQLGSKKSRKGCTHCKRRRVKCDEQAPCSNCARRGEQCSLLAPTTPASEADTAFAEGSHEWTQDLSLMNHYTAKTCMTIYAGREDILELWKTYIPQAAATHPSLMHAVLALAALHQAYLHPSPRERNHFLSVFDRHHTIAITAFRARLANFHPGASEPLFAMASLISVCAMAGVPIRCTSADPPVSMTMEDIAELFLLTRGVREVIGIAHEWVRQGPLAVMFHGHSKPDEVEVTLAPEVHQRFATLSTVIKTLTLADPDPSTRDICLESLGLLLKVFESIQYFGPKSEVVSSGTFMSWMTAIPTGLARLIQAHDVSALLVLYYYAAVTSAASYTWFSGDWPQHACTATRKVLPANFYSYLDWPDEQMRLGWSCLRVGNPGVPVKLEGEGSRAGSSRPEGQVQGQGFQADGSGGFITSPQTSSWSQTPTGSA